MKNRSHFILVGCGPHYRRRHHLVLEERLATLTLLIDLESKKEEILRFFEDKKVKPERMLFLPEIYRNTITPESLDALLPSEVDLSLVEGVIISTEPKAHKPYALWALSHDLPVFMDKPISAFVDSDHPDSILDDFQEMVRAADEAGQEVVVSCERRAHPGYQWVFSYLRDFMSTYKVPITGIDLHFAGGVWNLPHEYLQRENHPFKYGYGILLHSGYHYVDLLVRLLGLNREIHGGEYERKIQVQSSHPMDQVVTLGPSGYGGLVSDEDLKTRLTSSFLEKLEGFGETDCLLMGQDRYEDRVRTNFSLKLFGTSLCLRSEPAFTPELRGKVRQEMVTIHLGPFCSLHVTSYPFQKLDIETYPVEDFQVTILTSPLVQDRPPIQRLNREDFSKMYSDVPLHIPLNGLGRRGHLVDFIERKQSSSPLESHEATMELMSQIFTQIHRQVAYSS